MLTIILRWIWQSISVCFFRNEKGKLYRQYFLELEKAWNQPEQVMARALQLANTQIAKLQEQCTELGDQLIKQQMLLEDMAPKAAYLDLIMNSPSSVLVTQIAKDYGIQRGFI